ncbi:DUF2326 domain-containing protein [Hydrogenophaga sp. BPS33]|uniref:DUF2326 domain-containing protein n=1 Tax=Hydrogenophaga sp. BPS33 TaxID=2651974 RepID=UPI00131FD02C|nr:DUF2326 domain-containing protein [Hydrogenophaga sp. BPS33]QHE87234.1 DUF2326 domain-containing protein [Hydrogenophaga sp. BPS33]
MLKEIRCARFSHSPIIFHPGLNVILGDDDAKNSIGKSTVLMVIDFVLGGSTFTEKDDAGAIRELGPHRYDYSFQFGSERMYFSRATDSPDLVQECNEAYEAQRELGLDDYNRLLKRMYGLDGLDGTFRSTVGPFARIWKKGGLNPSHPFIAADKETVAVAISRLVDLFGRSSDVAHERKTLDGLKGRKKLINESMAASIIPKITKKQYEENVRSIETNRAQIEQLKDGFAGALNVYESLFDENLQTKQRRKVELGGHRVELQNKIHRLEREISGITPRLAANIALIADFFPTVDVQRLEQVEVFHQKIGGIVKRELKDELIGTVEQERVVAAEVAQLETEIQASLRSKGMPDDVFNQVFELKGAVDKASNENAHFESKVNIDVTIKSANERLENIYSGIFLTIESQVNSKLRSFNKVVYGALRVPSELRIKSATSYLFTSPDDTGTGKSYAGLVGFDLAMLSLTKLPLVLHDSVIYKNIEVPATSRILRIMAAMRSKQVFLSFDEAKKFGPDIEQLLNRFTVLKLAHDDLLYDKDWRTRK